MPVERHRKCDNAARAAPRFCVATTVSKAPSKGHWLSALLVCIGADGFLGDAVARPSNNAREE